MKRYLLIAITVFGVGWVLTLGLFYERGIESTFTVRGSNAWAEFASGNLRLYPNTWIHTDQVRNHGIPYLLSATMDQPPYPLSLCFTALAADPAQAMHIDLLEISYADGTTQIIELPAGKKRSQFLVYDHHDGTVYRHVNFTLPAAIQKRQAFNVKVYGFLESELGREPYREEIVVAIADKAYVYPGWIALWLQCIQ